MTMKKLLILFTCLFFVACGEKKEEVVDKSTEGERKEAEKNYKEKVEDRLSPSDGKGF
jgi:hypothetical protein